MEMDKEELMNIISGPVLDINDKFEQSTKNINDVIAKALKLCDNLKKKLLEKESLGTIPTKNSDMQFPTLHGKGLQLQKQAKCNTVSVSSVLTDGESCINIMEDSVAASTRGVRMARESKITSNVSTNTNVRVCTRGRHNKNMILDNSVNNRKRPAEHEVEEKNTFKKKIVVSTKNENDNKVFKKPRTRGKKKTVKNQGTESIKSLGNSTVEESQFFNAPLFFTSSPKIIRASPKTSNTTLTICMKPSTDKINHSSPNTKIQCSSKKSLNENISTPSPVPSSNDFINEGKNTESDENVPTVESNNSNIVKEKLEKTLSVNNNGDAKGTELLLDTPKLDTVRSDESLLKNQGLNDNIETDSKKSNTPQSRNLLSKVTGSKKSELNDPPKSSSTVILEKFETESQVPDSKNDEESVNSPRTARSQTSRPKLTREKNSRDLVPSPFTDKISPDVGGNLNTTKNIRKASKRTKPVLKSKIFDDKGNILPRESMNDSLKKETAENTCTLRSSPRTHSLNTSAVEEKNEKKTTEEKTPDNARNKRTRAKNAQKKQEVTDLPPDTGRVTRTKTKKANEGQENAGRKSGLTLLARKSLNKAKILSLKKEKFKILQILSSRVANPKERISSMNVYSHSKNQRTAPCLKSTENLLSSSKGKYLPLYNERAKRGETSDLLTKSAAKVAKENELDKELKLKALKEKEEEVRMKKEMAIKDIQKKLKEKNDMKLQLAMKQRQKLEMEKYNNILQSEKKKEAKRKLVREEMEWKKNEKIRKKKMEAEKKQAEAEERKRLKEEARKAKEKEQELERQRLLLAKEKEMKRHQKWAQERAADEIAREKYNNELKEQQMKGKALSSKKPDKSETVVTGWNYKSRNENDFGLENEISENDSGDEEPPPSNRPVPDWAKKVLEKKCTTINAISEEMMAQYMTCHSKTPDIQKMFKMTPRRKVKRTSSAIWNTPSS